MLQVQGDTLHPDPPCASGALLAAAACAGLGDCAHTRCAAASAALLLVYAIGSATTAELCGLDAAYGGLLLATAAAAAGGLDAGMNSAVMLTQDLSAVKALQLRVTCC